MRIVICYPTFPEFDTNCGALRLLEITKALVHAGHQVSFWALAQNDLKYQKVLEDLGICCFAGHPEAEDGSLGQLRQFLLQSNPGIAILVHHQVFNSVIPSIHALFPRCHCILDTVDLHYVRTRREAELSETEAARVFADASFTSEWAAIDHADSVWVVSETEKMQLRTDGLCQSKRVSVIGIVHVPQVSIRGSNERQGVVFIGGYKHSPNIDAVEFFMEQVYPLLRERRPEIQFTIAGSHPPPKFEKYNSVPGVRVTGFIDDHRALLESHLVSIAPLRFGAGVKGKIGDYLCTGTPCVTTSIGAEGMGLIHGKDVLIADSAEQFAAAVLKLHDDHDLWHQLSENGPQYVLRVLSPSAVKPALFEALTHAATNAPNRTSRWTFSRFLSVINPVATAGLAYSAYQSLRSGGLSELQLRYKRWITKK